MKHMEKKFENVFDFYCSRFRGADNFTAQLFNLFYKADVNNLSKLEKGFPVQVAIFREWQAAASEEEFFKRYGINY